MPLVGFETTVSTSERPQTYALDRPFVAKVNVFYGGKDIILQI